MGQRFGLLGRRFDFPGGGSDGAPLSRLAWQIEERSPLQIREDGLTGKEVAHLLRDHLKNMIEITPPELAPARAFYLRHGFEPCGPFAEYTDDPNSVFMTKKL